MSRQTRAILLAIDGTESSMRAARYALRVAKGLNTEITCIHVISKPLGLKQMNPALVALYLDRAERHAKKWIDGIKRMASEDKVSIKAEILIQASSVTEAIINYAKMYKIDLIILGTRGRSGPRRALLGSVANGVVMHAGCPVLLVR